jgi:hypothetical protein
MALRRFQRADESIEFGRSRIESSQIECGLCKSGELESAQRLKREVNGGILEHCFWQRIQTGIRESGGKRWRRK